MKCSPVYTVVVLKASNWDGKAIGKGDGQDTCVSAALAFPSLSLSAFLSLSRDDAFYLPPSTSAAIFSARASAGILVSTCALERRAIPIHARYTHRPCSVDDQAAAEQTKTHPQPITFACVSTTAIGSSLRPILHVQDACQF
jgi:hypothetical protein